LVHQSNGRALPASRSWNRVYAQGGWEWYRVSVLARVWARIPENPDRDDNPDIRDYVGRGDALIRWDLGGEYAVRCSPATRSGSIRAAVSSKWT